ncbi:MAG: fibronectin type III domain-containing protein [Bdellovibrionota bacterium]|nr:fibronectin type III domain-containing protein [Bdellovibrionota bacterium]
MRLLFLILSLQFFLASCSNPSEEDSTPETPSAENPVDPPTTPEEPPQMQVPSVQSPVNDLGPAVSHSLSFQCSSICEYRFAYQTSPGINLSSQEYAPASSVELNMDTGSYYFAIQAKDTQNQLESTVVEINVLIDKQSPTPVSNLSIQNDQSESSSPTASWDLSSDNMGISHYEISIGSSSGATDIQDFTNVGNLSSASLNHLALVDGTDYYLNIRAVDLAGNPGPVSSSTSWQIPGAPYPVDSLALRKISQTEIDLGWSAPNNNGIAITDYFIEYRPTQPADSAWITINDGVNTDTTVKVSGLEPSTGYQFQVRAYNGTSSLGSNILNAETAPEDPFFEPNFFKAMNLGGASKSIIVAWENDTEIVLNDSSSITLNAAESYEFESSLGDILKSEKFFFVSGRLTNGNPGNSDVNRNANVVWSSPDWAGKDFLFTGTRNADHRISVYSFENSSVEVYDGDSLIDQVVLNAGDFHQFSISYHGGFQLKSDKLILAYMYSGGDNYAVDPKPLLPASFDILGIPSRSVKITTASSNATANLYHSDSFTSSVTLSAGTEKSVNGRGVIGLYKEFALRIRSSEALVANSNADANGYCSAPFVPTALLKKKFIVNAKIDFVAFASLQGGDITVEQPDGTTSIVSLEKSGTEAFAPFKARVSGVPKGTKFYSSTRFQAWYQANGNTDSVADDDETILFGFD